MFLNTNDRVINLKNTSNINILKNKNRIIFNLNYSVQINTESGIKHVSDYVYWDAINEEDFKLNIKHLKENDFFKMNFISKFEDGYININEISSIKFSEKKYRVIFNLSHPISFNDNKEIRITSDFVYVNCHNIKEYKKYTHYIKKTIL